MNVISLHQVSYPFIVRYLATFYLQITYRKVRNLQDVENSIEELSVNVFHHAIAIAYISVIINVPAVDVTTATKFSPSN